MIVPELQLGELIATIPTYDVNGSPSLPLTYGWGTHKTLLQELRQRRQNEAPLYPLVWLIMPFTEEHYDNSVRGSDFTLILAVNTRKDPLNPERYEFTFRQYLIPNLELIKQALKLANNITQLAITQSASGNKYFDIVKFPNYGDPATFDGGDRNQVTEYWDAIQIKFRARFTQNCLNIESTQYNTDIITEWPYNN